MADSIPQQRSSRELPGSDAARERCCSVQKQCRFAVSSCRLDLVNRETSFFGPNFCSRSGQNQNQCRGPSLGLGPDLWPFAPDYMCTILHASIDILFTSYCYYYLENPLSLTHTLSLLPPSPPYPSYLAAPDTHRPFSVSSPQLQVLEQVCR